MNDRDLIESIADVCNRAQPRGGGFATRMAAGARLRREVTRRRRAGQLGVLVAAAAVAALVIHLVPDRRAGSDPVTRAEVAPPVVDVRPSAGPVAQDSADDEATVTLSVRSDPPGAQVTVDGVVVGKTPVEHRVRPHKCRLHLTLAGHRAHELRLDLQPDRDAEVHVSLRPDGSGDTGDEAPDAGDPENGILQIVSTPYAEVYIDGRRVGMTPISESVSPGRHRVVLINRKAAAKYRRMVVIEPGATVRIAHRF